MNHPDYIQWVEATLSSCAFQSGCELANIPQTRRQARKFLLTRGAAWRAFKADEEKQREAYRANQDFAQDERII